MSYQHQEALERVDRRQATAAVEVLRLEESVLASLMDMDWPVTDIEGEVTRAELACRNMRRVTTALAGEGTVKLRTIANAGESWFTGDPAGTPADVGGKG